MMTKMKFWLILSLSGIFGCLMTFTACSDDDEVIPPTITLETNTLTLAGGGESVTLTYNVADAPGGFLLPEVKVDANWLHVTDHSTLGSIVLQADPMPYAMESRATTVTLTLPEYPNVQATCTLSQGKNEEDFYINIDEVQADCVFYTPTPNAALSSYYYICTCITKEQAEEWGDDPKTVMYGLLERQNKLYEGVSWYWPALDGYSRFAIRPEQEVSLYLEPGKEYCIVALAYNGYLSSEKRIAKVEYKSKVVKRYFTTPDTPEEPQTATATIQVDVRGTFADATVTCSREDVYVWGLNIEANQIPKLTTDIIDVWTYHRSGYSYDKIMGENMTKGSHKKENVSSLLQPNSEYAYCVRLYDKHLHALTDWIVERYTTADPLPSDITFPNVEFSFDRIFTTTVTVTPSTNDSYLCAIAEEEEIADMSEEEVEAYLLNEGYWGMGGQDSFSITHIPQNKYVVLLAGATDYFQQLTTAVTRVPVQTPAVTFAPEMEASIKWVMQLDGDEYAEEFGVSSAKGKTVLAFWLNHSPEVNRYYMASFNMGIEQYFEDEDFDTEVCWTVYNYTYPYTQLPMITVVPQGSLSVGYYIGFPTNDEETKLGKPFVQKIDPKDLSVSSVSDFKSRVAAESATTRTAAPWDATPKELKRLDFPQLQR